MAKKIKELNFDMITTFLGTLGLVVVFWQSQIGLVKDQSDIKERLKEVEVTLKIKHEETKQ
jgi:hypothetical protein